MRAIVGLLGARTGSIRIAGTETIGLKYEVGRRQFGPCRFALGRSRCDVPIREPGLKAGVLTS